jgi:hypothetical protein
MPEVKQGAVWRMIDGAYSPREGDKLPSLSITLKAHGKVWTVVLVGEDEFGLQQWMDALRASLAFTQAACGFDIAALGCSPAEPSDEPPAGAVPS